MYSPLENSRIDAAEVKLTERQYNVHKCCAVILILVCALVVARNCISGSVLHVWIVPPIGLLAVVFHEFILFLKEIFHLKTRYEGKPLIVIEACFKNSRNWIFLAISVCYFIAVIFIVDDYSKVWKSIPFCILSAVILGLLESIRSHSNGALNTILKADLPQIWAEGAFSSFYIHVLKNFESRVKQFEVEHSVSLALKKLVVVVPLSCDVSGTFDERHEGIEYIADLPVIVTDQGANMNRRYKNPVYKVTPDDGRSFYLAMEQPAPILTICRMKGRLDKDILRYQRDSFISQLQKHFEGLPGIVLVFNDMERRRVPLASFLKDSVAQDRYENGEL